ITESKTRTQLRQWTKPGGRRDRRVFVLRSPKFAPLGSYRQTHDAPRPLVAADSQFPWSQTGLGTEAANGGSRKANERLEAGGCGGDGRVQLPERHDRSHGRTQPV